MARRQRVQVTCTCFAAWKGGVPSRVGRVQRAGGARAVQSGARSRTRGQEDGAMGAESRAVALLRGSRRADGARHQLPPWAASVAPRGWSSRGYYRIGSLS